MSVSRTSVVGQRPGGDPDPQSEDGKRTKASARAARAIAERVGQSVAHLRGSDIDDAVSFRARFDLPDKHLGPNHNKRSWAKKYRLGKAYREACGWIFTQAKPAGWQVGPVEIDVEYRHTMASTGYRPMDLQNAMASLKSLCDSMADAGIIPCDTKKWLAWGRFNLITKKLTDGVGEGVFVTVRRQPTPRRGKE